MDPLELWHTALAQLRHPAELSDTAQDDQVGSALLARWMEPHRRYHTLDHLRQMLGALAELTAPEQVPGVVTLASWFHDAVYDGVPGQDEEASAQLAETHLPPLRISPDDVAEVARLVRLTSTHQPTADDPLGALLVDADLSILGGTARDYARYRQAIRSEYARYDEATFSAARAQVLRAFLQREHLFHTERARQRWTKRARANLGAELSELTA